MADEVGGLSASVNVDEGNTQAALTRLKAALEAVEAQLRRASAAGDVAGRSVSDLAARKADLRVQVESLTARLGAETAAMHQQAVAAGLGSRAFIDNALAISRLDTSMKGVQSGSSNAARGLLMFSQGVEDAQYGLSAIVNNIPGVLMAFGAGAGLAGTISIAAVGINQLTKGWEGLADTFVGGAVKSAVQQMEDLGKATKLTADEQARLNELKRDEGFVKGVQGQVGPKEEANRRAFGAAVAGGNGQDIVDGLKAALRAEKAAPKMTPQEKGFIAANDAMDKIAKENGGVAGWLFGKLNSAFGFAGGADARRRVQGNLDALEERNVRGLLGPAANDLGPAGDLARKRLGEIVGRNPGMFPPNFREALERASPEGQAKNERNALNAEANANRQAFDKKEAVGDIDAELAREASNLAEAQREAEVLKKRAEDQAGFEAQGRQAGRDFRRKQAEEAVRDAPLFEQRANMEMLGRMAIGGMGAKEAEDFVRGRAKQELMDKGVNEQEALKIADRVAKGARRDVEEDQMARQLGLKGDFTNSTMMGIGQLGQAVQGAVTNKPNVEKDQLEAMLGTRRAIEAIQKKLDGLDMGAA